MTECERVNCHRKAGYIVQVIGYDIDVCWFHNYIHPITQLWANIQLKMYFWKHHGISWSLWVDVFPD